MSSRLTRSFIRSHRNTLLTILTVLLLPPATSSAASPSSSAATSLLFDKAVYGHRDCLAATLTAPALAPSSRPTLSLATLHNNRLADKVLVSLNETARGSGIFRTKGCVPLRRKKLDDSVLQVAPGDIVAGLAQGARGENLAAAIGSVSGGRGSGRFHAKVDDSLPAPPVTRPLDQAHIATAMDPQGRRASFIDNQILVQETKPGLLEAILRRYDGKVLNTVSFSSAPTPGTTPAAPRVYHVVQVDTARVPINGFTLLAERLRGSTAQGEWRYSSHAAI